MQTSVQAQEQKGNEEKFLVLASPKLTPMFLNFASAYTAVPRVLQDFMTNPPG